MTKARMNPYLEGHLFVAAIRIVEHQTGSPPELKEISKLLHLSNEQTGLISRRLQEAGIVKVVENAFGNRWGIADHLAIENLSKDEATSQMDEALKQFKAQRSKMDEKIESIKEQQAKKQKDLFSELEKQLKKDLSKK